MRDNSLLQLSVLAAAACAAPAPSRQAVSAAPSGVGTVQAVCPAVPDVKDLLNRHAGAFGSRVAVARALPRSFSGRVVTKGKKGAIDLVLDRNGRFSQTMIVGGMLSATGVDAKGPWIFPNAAVTVRLRADESVDLDFAAWLQDRHYLNSFETKRDAVNCIVSAVGPQIALRYQLPELGNPELAFSLVDAALLSATHMDVNGHETVLSVSEWSVADPSGVRWPLATHLKETSSSESITNWSTSVARVECPTRPAQDCLVPPSSTLAFSWPKENPVRVPAAFFWNEVLLHARVGGVAFWGLVDSGATLNVVDMGSPLARVFHPASDSEISTPESRTQLTLGEMSEAVQLGNLVVKRFPAAAVPMPSFDEFGRRRPEILFGHPIFLGTPVRIDYSRQEVLLSQDASSLHSKSAIAIPLKVLGQIVVAEAKIDGISGWFVLDSGDSEAIDLFQDWAAEHGFPGSRPAYGFRQQSEFGDSQADEKRMRPATFEFGPIRINGPLVAIDSVRSPSTRIAGQMGNGVFARCAAVVFDVPNRTLWLESPCDRNLPEDLSGWVLQRKDSPTDPNSPWIVRFVHPGGSAELAGVKVGDRLLRIGGKDATLERSNFESTTTQAPGTQIPAVILRGSDKKAVTLRLVRLLAH